MYSKTGKLKRVLLWLSIGNNLALLGFFKYYNFFADSFQRLSHGFGLEVHPYFLAIALPVGISFYTFHGMSYVFDIYYDKIKPVKSFVDYAVFVSFFPLLVAGPIERATHLLPQVLVKRSFSQSQAVAGLRLILWGYFKKVVIGDSSAPLVNTIFTNHHNMPGLTLILGCVIFGFQVYGDFSGYSDIARGTSKLLGFELIINFNFPYYAKSISDYWRRWHMSLNTWFMDYLYMPITVRLRDLGKGAIFIALSTTFFLSGLWHGAAWNYIIWGMLNGFALIFEILTAKSRKKLAKKLPRFIHLFFSRLFTIMFLLLTWVFFRARSAVDAVNFLKDLFNNHFFSKSDALLFLPFAYLPFLYTFMYVIEYINREHKDIVPFFSKIRNTYIRYSFYLLIITFILLLGTFERTAFVYFQF